MKQNKLKNSTSVFCSLPRFWNLVSPFLARKIFEFNFIDSMVLHHRTTASASVWGNESLWQSGISRLVCWSATTVCFFNSFKPLIYGKRKWKAVLENGNTQCHGIADDAGEVAQRSGAPNAQLMEATPAVCRFGPNLWQRLFGARSRSIGSLIAELLQTREKNFWTKN